MNSSSGEFFTSETIDHPTLSSTLIPRRIHQGSAPLSFAQQRLWFLDRWNPGSPVYNIPAILHMTGPLNLDVLEKCLIEIARRHEALRTTFVEEQGQPVQRIAAEVTLKLAATDLTHLPETERKAEADRITVEESRRPFDLIRGPLLRTRILRLSGKEHILILAMHHIVTDGWSMGVLFQELGGLYEAFTKSQASPLSPLPIQYPDFAVWQRQRLTGEALDRELKYWREQLHGLAVLELPTDRPRPPIQGYQGIRKGFTLPASLVQALKDLSRCEGTTLFMTMLAAFQTQLYRYSGQDDIAVGSPIANRNHKELEGLIGFFVNTVVMRTKLDGSPSFRELLHCVREVALDAYSHQDLPFEKLVEELKPERDQSRNPLFQVMMVLQNASELKLPGIATGISLGDTGTAMFDLLLELEECSEGINGVLEYNTDLFGAATIERMIGHFRTLLEGIVANPDQRVSELPLLTEAERHQLLVTWNDTKTDYPTETCLHRLFEAQVEKTPNAVAIVFEGKRLTYRELNARANKLAHYLMKRSVGPEALVGISMERSIEMIVALYGTIKAGAAYVPMDPTYPADRLAFLFEDAHASIILTQAAFREKLQSIAVRPVFLDSGWAEIDQESEDAPQSNVSPDNAAYMIYTSGSTGTPKGVVNTHRGIVNRLLWMQDKYRLEVGDVVMQKTPFGFDVSVGEFFGPLLAGATLVVARPEGHRDSRYLVDLIVRERVNVIHFVPSMLRVFLQEPELGICNSLKRVLCSGEALPLDLQNEFFSRLPDVPLLNLYGPTEAAVEVTYWDCKPDSDALTVPIGRPIANIRMYILDKLLQPLPVGIPGELHIGGIGVARGYYNRPELTAEKFIPDPFSPGTGARLYKTGDLARYMPDGAIEYLGRIDHQIKIRGSRIEPGEIEAILCQHPGVSEAAVVAWDDAYGDKFLAAYVVPKLNNTQSVTHSDLRQYLQQKLPEYMVPTIFVTLKEMILTSNGKVDRKALPAPEQLRSELELGYVAPRTPVEETLAAIWAEVLGFERVGIDNNFFDLGGHSLRATQVISKVRRIFKLDIPLRRLFESPTVAGFAEHVQAELKTARQDNAPVLAPVERKGDLPLSFAQQRLWFLEQWNPGSAVYNIPILCRMAGPLNLEALEKSLIEILLRHEALRTTFVEEHGQPVQRIVADATLKLAVTDLAHLPEAEREAEADRMTAEDSRRPFDLVHGPLLRARVLRLCGEDHVLILAMHHIVTDGWSHGVFFRELGVLYEAFSKGQDSPLAPLPIQYPDFAVWQRRCLQGEALDREIEYWREQLRGLAVLELPTDRPRPPVQGYRGNQKGFTLSSSLLQALNNLSRREGATLFMTLLAAFQTQLHRYSGQQDIAVGSPIANRSCKELEGLIGFFVNTLVMRTKLEGNPSFRELLRRVREVALEAYAHQNLPFEKLVEELNPERDPSRSPLFQVVLVLQNADDSMLSLPGIIVEQKTQNTGTAKFDLLMELEEKPEGLAGSLEYNTDLFDDATIERMIGHFRTLLEGIVANPDQQVSELPLLTEAERRQLMVEWNDTRTDYPRDACVHPLFEAQVERAPDAVAIVFEGETFTYRELNARANRLAHYLIKHGVGPDVLVGICVKRSLEMAVGLLGILKAGGAYVPLDAEYPRERLEFMVRDTGIRILLTQSPLMGSMPAGVKELFCLDADWNKLEAESDLNPAGGAGPENLAYVMYTSGSTGTPKGVEVLHRGIVRLVMNAGYARFHKDERYLQLATISFDASTFEIWAPLLHGASCVICPAALPSPEQLGELIRNHRVSTLWLTASLFNMIISDAPETLQGVSQLLIGGEQLSTPHVRLAQEKLDGVQIINGYGPTESTTFTCCYTIPGGITPETVLPIGRPIANTQVYILDGNLNPMPVGIPGEIYIGGDGLARGYLNRPELTAEKFIADPFSAGEGSRLYKTGDLARYRPDGNIEFLGRLDHQVKLRGYRIELGEIEAVLCQHPGISASAVMLREDAPGDKRLVAYVALKTRGAAQVESSELRRFLHQKLPDYMIPSVFVPMDAMNLTSSGKVDRRALPVPELHRPEMEENLIPPQNDIEKTLAAIWAKALGVEHISIHDNFFDLGGHSLRATQVISQIRRTFNVDLPLRQLFDTPTVAGLAQQVQSGLGMKRQKHVNIAPSIIQIQKNGSNPPLFILHDLIGDVNFAHQLAVNLGASQPVYGFHNTFGTIDSSSERRLEELASRYVEDLVAFQPNGPFCLAGYSFGGFLAYEMARQLSSRGLQVGHLAIIDTGPSFPNMLSIKEKLAGIPNFLKNIPWWVWEDFLTSKPSEFYQRLCRKIGEVGKRWKRNFNSKSRKADIADLEDIFELSKLSQNTVRIMQYHLKLLQDYQSLPYSGPLTLYRARTQPLFRLTKDDLGWRRIVSKGIEIVEIPGNHATIINEPNVRVLAKFIYAALKKLAQTSSADP
jgi:amino acid adenylation domain-containing protein